MVLDSNLLYNRVHTQVCLVIKLINLGLKNSALYGNQLGRNLENTNLAWMNLVLEQICIFPWPWRSKNLYTFFNFCTTLLKLMGKKPAAATVKLLLLYEIYFISNWNGMGREGNMKESLKETGWNLFKNLGMELNRTRTKLERN